MSPSEEKAQFTGPSQDYLLKAKAMDLEAGHLGKVFGTAKNSANNISGLIISALTLAAVVSIFIFGPEKCSEILKTLIPAITLGLGYIFGKSK